VVGSSLLFDQFDALSKDQIPLLYNIGLSPKLYSDPISYPTPGIVGWFAGQAMLAGKDGIKSAKLGAVNQAASGAACGIAKLGLKNQGINVLGTVTSNLTSPDRTADAASLMNGDPEGILLCGDDVYNVPMIKALRQAGYQGKVYSQASGILPEQAKSLGALGEGVRVSFNGEPSDNLNNSIVAEMVDSVNKYAPGTKLDETAAAGWSGVYLYAKIMAKGTSFTGPDVIKAIDAITTPIQGGVFGPFVGKGTAPFAQFPRLFSASFLPAEVKSGKVVPTGDFVTIPASILKQ
jgi:branched-chain amino acid transport system substrate-binding protein